MNVVAGLRSLIENWQRAALSAMGVMVGAVAIVLLVSVAVGVQRDIARQVEDLGVNVLVVLPGRMEPGNFNPNMAGQSFLTDAAADELSQVKGVKRVAKLTFVGGGMRYGAKEAYPFLIAASHEWLEMHHEDVESGRLLQAGDDGQRVCVMGALARDELFGKQDAVGKEVEIAGKSYRVLGVTQRKDDDQSMFEMQGFQNVVYVPYDAFKAQHPEAQINRIMVQSEPTAEPKALVAQMEAVLAKRLDRQQFSVLTTKDLLGLVFRVMNVLEWLLIGLTSIALFVAGVGIMSVMLMSVNERNKEIGVRKTVGARRRDIFQQFLVEAVAVSVLGVSAGLLVSWGACLALTAWTPIKPIITPGTVGMAYGVALFVGTVFGLLPAMKAARQDPVVALRNE